MSDLDLLLPRDEFRFFAGAAALATESWESPWCPGCRGAVESAEFDYERDGLLKRVAFSPCGHRMRPYYSMDDTPD